jgi:hypothetical protein
MAKRDRDLSPAEDYIEQLQWQSRHHRRFWPVRYEPKWKFRIVYRYPPVTPVDRALRIAGFAGVILVVVYFLASGSFAVQAGERIFYSLVIILIFMILLFAVRDACKDKEDKS